MSPDIKFFGSEEKVHVEGQVEAESVPGTNGKNRVLVVDNQEDADTLAPRVGQEIESIDTREEEKLKGKKGIIWLFNPPARLDRVEVKS